MNGSVASTRAAGAECDSPRHPEFIRVTPLNLDQRREFSMAQVGIQVPKGDAAQAAAPESGHSLQASSVVVQSTSHGNKCPFSPYKQLTVQTILPETVLEGANTPVQSYYGVPGCMHDSDRQQLAATSPIMQKTPGKHLSDRPSNCRTWQADPTLHTIDIIMPTTAPGAFRSPISSACNLLCQHQHTKTRLNRCTASSNITAPAPLGGHRIPAYSHVTVTSGDAAASVRRWLQNMHPGPPEHATRSPKLLALPDDIPKPMQARLDQLKQAALLAEYRW